VQASTLEAKVPTFRSDLRTLRPYVAGRPIEEITREFGIDDIVKLASNEYPVSPVPAAIQAITQAAADVNRYPDNSYHDLTHAIAAMYDTTAEHVWVGAGSSDILNCTARATGGPHTSILYASPSFVLYRIVATLAGSNQIEVPLTSDWVHDLEAMRGAIRDDTTMIIVCNPNNPTGTYVAGPELEAFIDDVDESKLVVIDEAYAEFATAEDFSSCADLALARPNVIVSRTFSKIYGLAGLRVGYALGMPETLRELRKAQPPFIVNVAAAAGAIAALDDPDEVGRRRSTNAAQRNILTAALDARGVRYADSQTNFVFLDLDTSAAELAEALLERGVIVRTLGEHMRITVGTADENRRCVAALDDALADSGS
jgi:histidinol-phosphate aminotransferase